MSIDQPGHIAPSNQLIASKPIRFDPLRRPSSLITRHVENVVRMAEAHHPVFHRSHDQETFRQAILAIVANCIAVSKVRKGALAVPRSNGVLRGGPKRYRPRCYGKPFVNALDAMAELELIAVKSRGFAIRPQARHSGTRGMPAYTTVVPTPKLAEFLPLGELATWDMLSRAEPSELIVLKGPNEGGKPGQLIDYPETAHTRRLRGEMQTINQWIADAPLSFDGGACSLVHLVGDGGMHALVTPDQRFLRRVFNDGSFSMGGRASGAFYQSMTNRHGERCRLLRLDGEPTIEVDYSAFNLRCAYAFSRQPFPARDHLDGGYTAGSFGTRRGWKLMTTALIGAKGALLRWPGKSEATRRLIRREFAAGTKAADVAQAIKAKHRGIVECFERGLGTRFQNIEAEIMNRVLMSLSERRIYALPIFDAVVCQHRHAEMVKARMEADAAHVLSRLGLIADIPARIKDQ